MEMHDHDSVGDVTGMSGMEENALRYVAGYVHAKTVKRQDSKIITPFERMHAVMHC